MSMSGRAAIFLDRDGTIIVDKHYLADPEGVELEHNAAIGLKALAAQGFVLVVISNQSGISRGLFSGKEADAVNARVSALLADAGVEVAGWYYCPHGDADDCSCRKPKSGLIERAELELGLDRHHSFVIGDKPSDVGLARAVGAEAILLETGEGSRHAGWAKAQGITVCPDLAQAAACIAAAPRSAAYPRSRVKPG